MSNTNYTSKLQLFITFILGSIILSSCLSNKKVVYYQSKKFKESESIMIQNPPTEYKLQSNDVLAVTIKSSNPETDILYNLRQGNQPLGGGDALYMQGYLVNDAGLITLPVLGDILVVDKTLEQAKQTIAEKLSLYLKEATLDVKLSSFRIAVYGEVSRPGLFNIVGGRVSIFQAIAQAGDMTDFANRRSVKLIRQKSSELEVTTLNLTKESILKSPYYYLHPNDQIYIEPMRSQIGRANIPLLSVIFTAISTTVLLINFLSK
jgi:polysaccharide biosynthesis/export protein